MPKSLPRTQALSTRTRSAKKQGRRRDRLAMEALDSRCMLSGTPTTAGVDALSLGDVNGDQFADIAVASHDATGNNYVTIYSGAGTVRSKMRSGYAALPLVKITNPLGVSSGPLDIALGDFSGTGKSQLAIASTIPLPVGGKARVGVWAFQNTAESPVNSTVTYNVPKPFTPSGMDSSTGFHIAAADLLGRGRDQLLIVPGGSPTGSFTVGVYHAKAGGWTYPQVVSIPSNQDLTQGASISAGYVTGDGNVDVVIGSKSDGQVSLYDGASQNWAPYVPFVTSASDVRVTAVSNVNAPGSVVVTGVVGSSSTAAIIPYNGSATPFTPVISPGAGALVPLGAGSVYQRSSVFTPPPPNATFPVSNGPVTPTVIFGATSASQLIVQGFATATSPSANDVYVERLANVKTKGFVPLQIDNDPSATAQQPPPNPVPINLIAYPKITYTSPYQVSLPNASSVTQGLYPFKPLQEPGAEFWGPDKQPNAPPTVPTGDANDWLRQRVVASLNSFIGADYQHHHDPRWLPAQGSGWNIAATVTYQSQGIDCTDLTAFVYADAMGILMTSDTADQGNINSASLLTIPRSMESYIDIKRISAYKDKDHTVKKTYDEFTKELLPGDILYIYPQNSSTAKHGITWLGQYGVDTATGKTVPLVIDATGINPQHTDQNHMVVPQGVHIRPFGKPVSTDSWEYPNSWYFDNVDHALRIIKDPPTR